MRDSDFRMELKHLLGDARFRSMRQHCLVYENLRKRGFVAIPWRESADEISPYKLQQIWQTLNWLSKIFGLLKVDEHQRLVTKKKALDEELAPTVVRPQKKTAVPSREVIWALEEGAALGGPPGAPGRAAPAPAAPGRERHEQLDAFILGFARFQVGCSARFDDLQHVRPEELRTTSNTIELQAWQTKVARAARIRTKPVPLICPKYSFSGAPWYLQFVSTVRKLSVLKAFEGMDYLLPTISKDFAGLIPRPSGGDRALRWLKDALRRRGVAQEHVTPLTFGTPSGSSFRTVPCSSGFPAQNGSTW